MSGGVGAKADVGRRKTLLVELVSSSQTGGNLMNVRANQVESSQTAELPPAPAASAFPASPAAWYLFCPADDLRRGPVSKRLLSRHLVAFRTASGEFAVLEARCAHLGADLGCGEVVGETIQCPFHHW
jgi:hypothetical protein